MSMTPTDEKRYKMIVDYLRFWQGKRALKIHEVVSGKSNIKQMATQLADLLERVENLEKLMFFSLLNDMGEIGITPELRTLLKELGWQELFDAFDKIMKTK